MNLKTLLFDFHGRINRAKYWLGVLVISGVMLVGLIGAVFIGLGSGLFIILNPFLLVAFAVTVWISIATGIKRLHDRNKSGWWLLLFYLAPTLIERAGAAVGEGTAGNFALGVLSLAIGIWGFIEFGCLRGTAGSNTYGPDPLDQSPALPPLPSTRPAPAPPRD